MSARSYDRSRLSSSGRETARAGARATYLKQMNLSPEQLRSEAAKRALLEGDPQSAPLLVAAAALLYAQGRHDFKVSELRRERDLLVAELRRRHGFTEEEVVAAAEAWTIARAKLEAELGGSTFRVWIADLEPAGLIGAGETETLWLSGPGEVLSWTDRRYRPAIERAAGVRRVRFLGIE